jgi:uncharacterized surface protein with fasciclin (FAS1) repeats
VVAEIVGDASDSFDTLEEIAAWIEAHPNDVAAMVKRITDLETAMGGKVSKTDIINTLDNTALDKPLSAAMGAKLNAMLSEMSDEVDGKATPEQVAQAISDALAGYALKDHNHDGTYIRQTELNGAVNTALQIAKESGDFDGESVTISKVTESTESGGKNVVEFAGGKTLIIRNGKDGDPYTLTEADIVAVANKVIEHFGGSPVQCVVTDDAKIILTGVPVGTYTAYFNMGDGELAECGVLALSDETPLNTYTVTFVADGVTVATIEYTEGDTALSGVPDVPAKDGYTGVWESYDISKGGNITVNAVYTEIPANTYTVTKTATYCVISGNDSATEDEAYTATVTANSGYEMSSIKVTMGGADITSSVVSGGNINIANVTGHIVITATATKVITNWLPLATLADGDANTISNGIVYNKRLGTSNGEYRDLTGHKTTGFIRVKYGDEVFIYNITLGGGNEFICYYGEDMLRVIATSNTGMTLADVCTAVEGGYTTPINSSVFSALGNVSAKIEYIRICGSGITENTVINIKRNGEWR